MKRRLLQLLQSAARRLAPALYGPARQAIDAMRAGQAEAERRKWQSCGAGVRVSLSVRIVHPRGMAVGNNVHIGDDCYIQADGGVQIGDNTHISRRVTIYSSDHEFGPGEALPYGPDRRLEEVRIGRNVWIGMNVCLLPGVTIGDGAIVGMGCIVSRDVGRGEIVGQPPFRVLGSRSAEDLATLDAERPVGGRNGKVLTAEETARFRPGGRDMAGRFVFVVTTGRSGSTTIADVLDNHPDIVARHEPRIQLIHWSTQFERGEISREDLAERLDALLLRTSVYPPAAVHLESDQKMSNMIGVLREVIPGARFVWLTRRAEEVVASAVARGWYDPEAPHDFARKIYRPWVRYRVTGADAGDYTAEAWDALTPFERNCWYWAHVNRTIRDQLAALPREGWHWLDIGELPEALPGLLDFLGVSPRALPVSARNASTYGRYAPAEWDPAQREIYARHCGALMHDLYEARAFA